MSQRLTLPDELFNKLSEGAAQRGLSIEALLNIVSQLVVLPQEPTKQDLNNQRRIDQLFDKFKAGPLTAKDRAELDRLIDRDYENAIRRADQLIAAKAKQPTAGKEVTTSGPHSSSTTGSTKRSRK